MQTTTNQTLLIFRVGGIPFALPAQSVGSILMTPEHITRTPGSQAGAPGIFHHADAVYGVINLHERFASDTALKGSGQLLLHKDGIHHFAFLVDKVVGLVQSEEGKWARLPPYLPADIFTMIFLHENEMVLCTELPLLRNLHDIEPLRHHALKLEQQNDRKANDQETKEKPTPASSSIENKTATKTTIEETQANTEAIPEAPVKDHEERPKVASSPPSSTADVSPPPATEHDSHARTVKTPVANPVDAKPLDVKPFAPTTRSHPASLTVEARSTTTMKPPVKDSALQREQLPSASTMRPHSALHSEAVSLFNSSTPAEVTQPDPVVSRSTAQEASSNQSWLWLFLFLLLLVALPLGYWLWSTQQRPQRAATRLSTPPPTTISVDNAVHSPMPEKTSSTTLEEPSVIATEVPQTVTVEEPPPAETRDVEEDRNTDQQLESVEKPVTTTDSEELPPLQINQDEDGTINLIINRQAAVKNSSTILTEAETESRAQAADTMTPEVPPLTEEVPAAEVEIMLVSSEQEKLDAEAASHSSGPEACDCTHIVVKGDTLWDIAQLYTGNAFNYPELAKLSGIKNPHRIYPGNRVRIIIR